MPASAVATIAGTISLRGSRIVRSYVVRRSAAWRKHRASARGPQEQQREQREASDHARGFERSETRSALRDRRADGGELPAEPLEVRGKLVHGVLRSGRRSRRSLL